MVPMVDIQQQEREEFEARMEERVEKGIIKRVDCPKCGAKNYGKNLTSVVRCHPVRCGYVRKEWENEKV